MEKVEVIPGAGSQAIQVRTHSDQAIPSSDILPGGGTAVTGICAAFALAHGRDTLWIDTSFKLDAALRQDDCRIRGDGRSNPTGGGSDGGTLFAGIH